MARRVLPAVLLLVSPVGCEVTSALFSTADEIALPADEAAQVKATLATDPANVPAEVLLAAVSAVLAPLPVESARFDAATNEIRVVIGPLVTEVLDDVVGGLGTGGWIGILVASVGAAASLAALVAKKLSLLKRAQPTPAVTP